MRHTSLSAALLVALLAGLPAPVQAAAEPPVPLEKNCFFQLLKTKSDVIDCLHPTWLTPEERADLERVSRGLVRDARCQVAVRIERRVVDTALSETDFVFEAPPQPVSCEVTTRSGATPITATFAPRVVFKGGVAVEATPGLANVQGVNPYLAWPVVHYVNHAPRIRGAMLLMINAFRQRPAELADEAPH